MITFTGGMERFILRIIEINLVERIAEQAGTIRAGMNAMFAILQTTVPWFACVLRRSYGVAQGIHLGPGATVVA